MHTKKKNRFFILGIIVIIIGVIIGLTPILINNKEKAIDNNKIEKFINETSTLNNIDNISNIEESTITTTLSTEEKKAEEDNYIMILEIPKVKLKRGIYALHSKLNSVKYNIAIMKESSFPDVEANNLILAAHNGNSKVSYFNQLHNLASGDEALIYYNGIKYTYTVDRIYDVQKDGELEIKRDITRNTLTLITCKKNTKDKQIVIILYLINKEEY